jgi:methionyl-tRNA formyltransferase
MGTPEIAKRTLEKLEDVVAIYTKPDTINKRGKGIEYSPVKKYSIAENIKLFQPSKLGKDVVDQIRAISPDLIVIVAYGQIIPKEIIEIPKYGAINYHMSLLPKYRGASPIHSPILNGDDITGGTIMYIDENMDSGDIILQRSFYLDKYETYGTLYEKFCELGPMLINEAINLIKQGKVIRKKQNHKLATYTKKIKKEEMLIEWSKNSKELERLIRSFSPFMPAYFFLNGVRIKIFEARSIDEDVVIEKLLLEGPVIPCGRGSLLIKSLQVEGRNRMSGRDAINSGLFKKREKN